MSARTHTTTAGKWLTVKKSTTKTIKGAGKSNKTVEERDGLRQRAWLLRCQGNRSYAEIAKEIGVSRTTAKKYIDQERKRKQKELAAGPEMADILGELQAVRSAAWDIFNDEGIPPQTRVAALSKVLDGLKAEASIFGVSLEAQELTQNKPFVIAVVDHVTNEQVIEVLERQRSVTSVAEEEDDSDSGDGD